MPDDTHKLSAVALFRGLGEAELHELLAIARTQSFSRGSVVVHDGDRGAELFVVLSGRVRISLRLSGAQEETLGTFGPGDSFGEMAVLGDPAGATRSASVSAVDDCTMLAIDGASLRKLVEEDRDLGFVLLRNLVGKLSHALRSSNDKVSLLAESARF
ncbi:MAG: cyclic nucleotide-binding domain-containing protein [bacterium]|nr:cyclic nucleotide-binding domain-containing protein [bacterium]